MGRILSFSCVLAGLVGIVFADPIKSESPLAKYIGEFSQLFPVSQNPSMEDVDEIRQTSFYFLSRHKTAYDNGLANCQAELGEKATLGQIETEEELTTVTHLLQQQQLPSNENTAGEIYNSTGLPGSTSRRSPYNSTATKLVTGSRDMRHGYICELQVSTERNGKVAFLGQDPVKRKRYFINMHAKPYDAAKAQCKALGSTYDLINFDHDGEASIVADMLKRAGINTNADFKFWTGGMCNLNTRVCKWSKGEKMPFPVHWPIASDGLSKSDFGSKKDGDLPSILEDLSINKNNSMEIKITVSPQNTKLPSICESKTGPL